MALTTDQKMLIEQRISNDSKSLLVAYLLLFFVGFLGAHRFYLGKTTSAIIMLALTILGWLLTTVVVGFVLLAAVGIWFLIDIFMIPSIATAHRNNLRMRLSTELANEA